MRFLLPAPRTYRFPLISHSADEYRSVVKLVKNFRSHPAILNFPNEQFYGGDLQPCAPAATINAFLSSPLLPKNPVIFHAVTGKDDREASSPSFFNVDEVLQVKSYVQRLTTGGKFKTGKSYYISHRKRCILITYLVADKDIGVITPYHAQCLKIRSVLGRPDVKVGSVEEFQGQERKVIIVSTVRSSKDFVEYDLRHTLGFVANPRRFNGQFYVLYFTLGIALLTVLLQWPSLAHRHF
jgi:helicase MOV-10